MLPFVDTQMNGCLVAAMMVQVLNLIEPAFVDILRAVLVEELVA